MHCCFHCLRIEKGSDPFSLAEAEVYQRYAKVKFDNLTAEFLAQLKREVERGSRTSSRIRRT